MRYVLAFVFALWPLPGFLLRGERRTTRLGSVLRSAYTRMKGRGTASATATTHTEAPSPTTEAFSSWEALGLALAEEHGLIRRVRASSSTAPSSSTDATATVGGSGEPHEPADCDSVRP